MTSLLVTGGAGFIGTNFALYWLSNHSEDQVVVLDALTYAGNRSNLASIDDDDRFVFVHGDIRDSNLVEELLEQKSISTVVHFAAESHVDRSIHGPTAFVDTNIVGTHKLLEACRTVWLDSDTAPTTHRFHHVSTDEVYGSLTKDAPAFSEHTPYSPNSPYAASKAASDHLVRSYHHTYGLQTSISNCSNNYGPYQFPEKLIPLMVVNALSDIPLPVYGDGSNIRDWLFVEDHARAIDLILNSDSVGETFNIGGNEEWANIDIVHAICRCVDDLFSDEPTLQSRFPSAPASTGRKTESLISFVSDRPGHDWRYAIDASKARSLLGFKPAYDFEAGLKATVGWMIQNEAWWRSIQSGSYKDWVKAQYGLDTGVA